MVPSHEPTVGDNFARFLIDSERSLRTVRDADPMSSLAAQALGRPSRRPIRLSTPVVVMSAHHKHRSGLDSSWFDRLLSGLALFATVVIAIAALLVASVIGNRVNLALPRGFGLVGVLVAVGLLCPVLVLLIAPDRLWQHARIAVERRRVHRGSAVLVETRCDGSYDHSAWLVDDDPGS
jgi:hypothetical protein